MEENQVQTQAMSLPRMGSPLANPLEGFSKALNSTADTVGKIVEKEAAEQDASRISDETSKYENEKVKFLYGTQDAQGKPVPGLMHTIGEAAVNPTDGVTLEAKTDEWFKKYMDTVLPTLGNQRQKDLFRQHLEKDLPTINKAVLDHEFKQGQVVKIGNAERSTDTLTDTVIAMGANPLTDPQLYQDTTEKLKQSIQVQSLIKGYGPESEYTKNLTNEKISKVHSNIVMSLIGKDQDAAAIDYYKLHEADITDPAMKRAIEPTITKIIVLKDGKDVAATAWETGKPKDINQMPDLEAMRAEIAKSGKPDQVKLVAEKRVEELSNEYLQKKRFKQEEAGNRVYALPKQGASYASVVKSIELDQSIDQGAKDNLLEWADHKYGVSQAKAEARADARAEERQKKSLGQLNNLLQFQNNYLAGKYGTKTPDQLAGEIAALGPFTDNAMQFVNNVNNDLGKAKITEAELTDTVRLLSQNKEYAKMLPNLKSPSEQDKAKMALLHGKVQEIIARSKDKPGAGKTVQGATLEAIQQVTTEYNKVFSNTREPAYVIGTDLGAVKPKDMSTAAQNRLISDRFYANPNNKGKHLTFKQIEAYRQDLLRER